MAARIRCTVQVCTMLCGQVASIASGKPVSPMPLWMSSGGRLCCDGWGGAEESEDLAGDVAFEAADYLAAGLAFGEASLQVGLGIGVPTEPGESDPVEGGVGFAVAAAVEPPPLALAGRGLHRASPHRARRRRPRCAVA